MIRLLALIRKEALQALRDPAVMLIAFVLPPVMLFLYANAVSLDVDDVKVGVVMEGDGEQARALAAAFDATDYLRVTFARHRQVLEHQLVTGELKAIAVIPADFEARVLGKGGQAAIQVIADAANPNSANFTAAYLRGVYEGWLVGLHGEQAIAPAIQLAPRFWFNPELDSSRVLIPGSMAVIMTIIGTLLTAMVISREWERGTMEALLATPVSLGEIIVSKLLPYFLLAGLATIICTLLAVHVFDVPLRGSFFALSLATAAFLVPALGQGLLISSIARTQLLASLGAMITGFLPAMLLSGFVFETRSMPWLVELISRLIPARYYVSSLQTVYLAGDVWPLLLRDMAAMLAVGGLFLGVVRVKLRGTLD